MRKSMLAIFFFWLMYVSPCSALDIAGEATVPLPENWYVDGNVDSYPVRLKTDILDAELLIFRTVIDEDEAIMDDHSLRRQVDAVIGEVIEPMDGASVLSSTGFHFGDHCHFNIEFAAGGAGSGSLIWNRLTGLIYRLEDNSQVMYTLWGKVVGGPISDPGREIITMTDEFQLVAPHAASVYGEVKSPYHAIYIVIGFAAAVIVLTVLHFRRRRSLKTSVQVKWRCGCGASNPEHRATCEKCGFMRPNAVSPSIAPQVREAPRR